MSSCKLTNTATGAYLQSGNRYGYVGYPSGFFLQKPSHFVSTPVEERVPGHRVPALGGQRFSQGQVVVRPVRAATSNLKS